MTVKPALQIHLWPADDRVVSITRPQMTAEAAAQYRPKPPDMERGRIRRRIEDVLERRRLARDIGEDLAD